MNMQRLVDRYYSDPKYDGPTIFYDWIRELALPSYRVLNLGAGPATRNTKRNLRGTVSELVGADFDAVVLDNDELDRAYVIESGKIPIDDGYFDLIFSDWVVEHVEHPEEFLSEVHRLLKPGGSFLFRTPNKHHYTALVSRFTPHWFHKKVANQARRLGKDAHEPWPTFYRMNSRRRLRQLARNAGFGTVEMRMVEFEPAYLRFHFVPFLLGIVYERAVNSSDLFQGIRVNILGRFQKPQTPNGAPRHS